MGFSNLVLNNRQTLMVRQAESATKLEGESNESEIVL